MRDFVCIIRDHAYIKRQRGTPILYRRCGNWKDYDVLEHDYSEKYQLTVKYDEGDQTNNTITYKITDCIYLTYLNFIVWVKSLTKAIDLCCCKQQIDLSPMSCQIA